MSITPSALLLTIALTVPLQGADLEIGIRHLSTTLLGESTFEGGKLDIVRSRGFAATAEVFWTSGISTQLAGTFVNPAAILFPATPPPNDLDLGTFGIDVYSLTARYHLASQSRASAFAGAGGAIVSFGDLDDRFGDDIEVAFDRELAAMVEGGVRYRIASSLYFDAAVSYLPVDATPNRARNQSNVTLPERVHVDPLTLSIGAAWRF